LIYTGYLTLRSGSKMVPRRHRRRGAGHYRFSGYPAGFICRFTGGAPCTSPSILRPDKAPWENVHPAMLSALAISFIGFLLLYFYLLSLRYRVGEMREEIKARRLERAE
jgi:hypothetical protein